VRGFGVHGFTILLLTSDLGVNNFSGVSPSPGRKTLLSRCELGRGL
jgi:hypothetical protein